MTRTKARFETLVQAAQTCERCATMTGRARILSTRNGPAPASVMLVGEAPGRLGAERTGIPFHGDESGRRLERLLAAAGWERSQVFITNAVLCNPLTSAGNNRPPSPREVLACQDWLVQQIEIVSPLLVVSLGLTALRALHRIDPHDLTLPNVGCEPVRWFGRHLGVTYHPGARATIHRPVAAQLADFAALGAWLRLANAGSADNR